jgi:hypothetical protein
MQGVMKCITSQVISLSLSLSTVRVPLHQSRIAARWRLVYWADYSHSLLRTRTVLLHTDMIHTFTVITCHLYLAFRKYNCSFFYFYMVYIKTWQYQVYIVREMEILLNKWWKIRGWLMTLRISWLLLLLTLLYIIVVVIVVFSFCVGCLLCVL